MARNGPLSRAQWDVKYDVAINQAKKANAAVDTYYQTLGYGQREVTVDAGGDLRRLDIADAFSDPPRGIEYKAGPYVTRDPDINYAVSRDKILVQKGWSITWVFEGKLSKPLEEDLTNAGIRIARLNKYP